MFIYQDDIHRYCYHPVLGASTSSPLFPLENTCLSVCSVVVDCNFFALRLVGVLLRCLLLLTVGLWLFVRASFFSPTTFFILFVLLSCLSHTTQHNDPIDISRSEKEKSRNVKIREHTTNYTSVFVKVFFLFQCMISFVIPVKTNVAMHSYVKRSIDVNYENGVPANEMTVSFAIIGCC